MAKPRLTLLWPGRLQPTRLLCPWDFSGNNTGLSYHSLLQRDLPKWEIKPASPALAGGLFSTAPPAKPIVCAGFGTTRPPLETLDHIPLGKVGTTVWPNSFPKWFSQPYSQELCTEFASLPTVTVRDLDFYLMSATITVVWLPYPLFQNTNLNRCIMTFHP